MNLSKGYAGHQGYQSHKRILSYSGLKGLCLFYNFKIEKIKGVGYYPFPIFISKLFTQIDKRHAAFITIKVRKINKIIDQIEEVYLK